MPLHVNIRHFDIRGHRPLENKIMKSPKSNEQNSGQNMTKPCFVGRKQSVNHLPDARLHRLLLKPASFAMSCWTGTVSRHMKPLQTTELHSINISDREILSETSTLACRCAPPPVNVTACALLETPGRFELSDIFT